MAGENVGASRIRHDNARLARFVSAITGGTSWYTLNPGSDLMVAPDVHVRRVPGDFKSRRAWKPGATVVCEWLPRKPVVAPDRSERTPTLRRFFIFKHFQNRTTSVSRTPRMRPRI